MRAPRGHAFVPHKVFGNSPEGIDECSRSLSLSHQAYAPEFAPRHSLDAVAAPQLRRSHISPGMHRNEDGFAHSIPLRTLGDPVAGVCTPSRRGRQMGIRSRHPGPGGLLGPARASALEQSPMVGGSAGVNTAIVFVLHFV